MNEFEFLSCICRRHGLELTKVYRIKERVGEQK